MGNSSALLLLEKKPGVTSFSSLKPVKRTIDRKVGHAGTLDKFAEGLMIVLTGAFTKLNPLLSGMDKRYVATVRFGEETDTLDPEGTVVHTAEPPDLETVEQVVRSHFTGTILQHPPQYSAVHIDGKRAYRLAREGQEVEMPVREVSIYHCSVIGWNPPEMQLEVHCSKGTYIRSLARDIAIACNSRAHLRNLVRTAIGPFSLDEAVDPEDADALRSHADHSVGRVLRIGGMGAMTVSDEAALRLSYGNLPDKHGIMRSDLQGGETHAAVFDGAGTLLAVVGIDADGLPVTAVALPCVRND